MTTAQDATAALGYAVLLRFAYDGNGNIIAWSAAEASHVEPGKDTILRLLDYDPFGNVHVRHSPEDRDGTVFAEEIPFGFSTKFQDGESGFSYYGTRYCDHQTGRWLSRDPIEENGGKNIYAFLENDSSNNIDFLGLLGKFYQILERPWTEWSHYNIGWDTGYMQAYQELRALSGYKVKWESPPTKRPILAGYKPSTDTIYLPPGLDDVGSVLHELTHAYNDLKGKPFGGKSEDNTEDEGMAYFIQYQTGSAMPLLIAIESHLKDRLTTCDDLENVLDIPRAWKAFWKDKWEPSTWGNVTWFSKGGFRKSIQHDRRLALDDFVRVRDHLGANFSCSRIRDSFNAHLEGRGCCFRLSSVKQGLWDFSLQSDGNSVYSLYGPSQTVILEY